MNKMLSIPLIFCLSFSVGSSGASSAGVPGSRPQSEFSIFRHGHSVTALKARIAHPVEEDTSMEQTSQNEEPSATLDLRQRQKETRTLVSEKNSYGGTPLLELMGIPEAVLSPAERLESARFLLHRGADPNADLGGKHAGWSGGVVMMCQGTGPLYCAWSDVTIDDHPTRMEVDIPLVALLLAYGADFFELLRRVPTGELIAFSRQGGALSRPKGLTAHYNLESTKHICDLWPRQNGRFASDLVEYFTRRLALKPREQSCATQHGTSSSAAASSSAASFSTGTATRWPRQGSGSASSSSTGCLSTNPMSRTFTAAPLVTGEAESCKSDMLAQRTAILACAKSGLKSARCYKKGPPLVASKEAKREPLPTYVQFSADEIETWSAARLEDEVEAHQFLGRRSALPSSIEMIDRTETESTPASTARLPPDHQHATTFSSASSAGERAERVGEGASSGLPEEVVEKVMRNHFPTVAEGLGLIRLRPDLEDSKNKRAEVLFRGEEIDGERSPAPAVEEGDGVLNVFSGFDTMPDWRRQTNRFMQLSATLRRCPDQSKIRDFASLVAIGARIFQALSQEKELKALEG
ncbi:unnamed protein product [Amoebophrya sp. A25]|nr:unnamed protein product [Amoebophrya sp. A25]|eukprot:GSA25T00020295001.1